MSRQFPGCDRPDKVSPRGLEPLTFGSGGHFQPTGRLSFWGTKIVVLQHVTPNDAACPARRNCPHFTQKGLKFHLMRTAKRTNSATNVGSSGGTLVRIAMAVRIDSLASSI